MQKSNETLKHEHNQILELLHTWDIANIELALMLAKGKKIDIKAELKNMLNKFSFLTFPKVSFVEKIAWLMNNKLLDLNNNQLTQLPNEIGNLVSLEGLYLYSNQLTQLPAEIGNLVSLERLNLHNNELTQLPTEIGNLVALKWLYLSGNNLSKKEQQRIQSLLPNCEIFF